MQINLRILFVGTACLALLAACNSGQQSKGDVAATVNGRPITEQFLGLMLKQRTDLGKPIDPDVRKNYLDRLTTQLAIAMEAEKKGLDKNPEVMAKIELNRQAVLVSAFVEDFMKNNPLTDDEIKAEYERIKTAEAGTEYKARHILVETEAEAKAIIAQLNKNPKSFDVLAQEKSKDTVSKVRGGDLGWILPKRLVPEFSNALIKLEKGKFTQEPVKSQFGYHVILLEDSRPLVMAPLEQYKARLKESLQQQKLQKTFDELKAKAKIEIAQKP
jgi:peptidyl-prolyl cis-trans isomerase C